MGKQLMRGASPKALGANEQDMRRETDRKDDHLTKATANKQMCRGATDAAQWRVERRASSMARVVIGTRALLGVLFIVDTEHTESLESGALWVRWIGHEKLGGHGNAGEHDRDTTHRSLLPRSSLMTTLPWIYSEKGSREGIGRQGWWQLASKEGPRLLGRQVAVGGWQQLRFSGKGRSRASIITDQLLLEEGRVNLGTSGAARTTAGSRRSGSLSLGRRSPNVHPHSWLAASVTWDGTGDADFWIGAAFHNPQFHLSLPVLSEFLCWVASAHSAASAGGGAGDGGDARRCWGTSNPGLAESVGQQRRWMDNIWRFDEGHPMEKQDILGGTRSGPVKSPQKGLASLAGIGDWDWVLSAAGLTSDLFRRSLSWLPCPIEMGWPVNEQRIHVPVAGVCINQGATLGGHGRESMTRTQDDNDSGAGAPIARRHLCIQGKR
ncbi:hypothetical protein NM208_g14512 [Fusarium decemcellulare]|uniref:Uncharacterized protein n=1 Tax=Fusarium decemcellulare TaxID=57161 RepID=A0ACC1RHK9_9HYPO|nr:hypothetical protein NM208_g14512 [Fusarium decemcellulare]